MRILGKRGLTKRVTAEISNSEKFTPQVAKRKYRSRSREPLKVDYSVPNSTRHIPSLGCFTTCSKNVEDLSLREARERSKARTVQLYNKGPYGMLTPMLAAEMAAGDNRRRS